LEFGALAAEETRENGKMRKKTVYELERRRDKMMFQDYEY